MSFGDAQSKFGTAVTGRSVIYLRKLMQVKRMCTMDTFARFTRWQLGICRGEGERKGEVEGGRWDRATHRSAPTTFGKLKVN